MFQFNCQIRDAAESYEVFQYARHWAGEFMELVIVLDDRTGLYHTWIEFKNAELYFPHFRMGEKSLGSESLIELLVDLGSEQVIAEEEVRQGKYYLSVSWFNEMVEDPKTGQKAVRGLLRCFRVPPDRQRKRQPWTPY